MPSDNEFILPYVSTGYLPEPEFVERLVREAYERFKGNDEGEISEVYPALAGVPRDLSICVVSTSGRVYAAGEVEHEFSIMSVSKPFVFTRSRSSSRSSANLSARAKPALSSALTLPAVLSIRSPPSRRCPADSPTPW